jgi:hypothetical protein
MVEHGSLRSIFDPSLEDGSMHQGFESVLRRDYVRRTVKRGGGTGGPSPTSIRSVRTVWPEPMARDADEVFANEESRGESWGTTISAARAV